MSVDLLSAGDRPGDVLQMLVDKDAIGQVIRLYGFSLDRRDWPLHRSLFVDEIEMDYRDALGPSARMKADDWIAAVGPFFANLSATQHLTNPVRIDVAGDDAYVLSQLHAQHFLPNSMGAPVQRMIGWYENWLVRTAGGWKFRKIVMHVDWNEGNAWIVQKAAGQT